jgi:hypothetical protein
VVTRGRSGSFSSPTELATWLLRAGVDTSEWGKDDHKSVRALYDEIEQHDCWVSDLTG